MAILEINKANINNHHPLLIPSQYCPFAPTPEPLIIVWLVVLESVGPISMLFLLPAASLLTRVPYGRRVAILTQKSMAMNTKMIMTASWKAIPASMRFEAASGTGASADAAHPPPIAWRTRETISAVRKIATNYR